jgi:septal ring-binding cell division protein DamX
MSLTISELESERAKILEEIESKAQNLSSSKTQSAEGHSLQDWLDAAEEVMPQSEPAREQQDMSTNETRSNYAAQMIQPSKDKASFFGVIIMLSLLLTLLGVLYIAYTSIHKELQGVIESNTLNTEKMNQLQLDMDTLQKSLSTGGKAELFISLEDKVFALEAQVSALKNQNTDVVQGLEVQPATNASDTAIAVVSDGSNKIVTEAVLDQKLGKLEQKIDDKLQTILNYLANGDKTLPAVSVANQAISPKTNMPTEPTIAAVKTPVIQQPLIQLVQPITAPKAPSSPQQTKAPIENYTADVKWLMNEPAIHYTLQLASMPDQAGVETIVRKKGLKDVKAIPQTRNETKNYVLITGSFADRKTADKFAKQYKSEFGISPWVRKIKDISARVK